MDQELLLLERLLPHLSLAEELCLVLLQLVCPSDLFAYRQPGVQCATETESQNFVSLHETISSNVKSAEIQPALVIMADTW